MSESDEIVNPRTISPDYQRWKPLFKYLIGPNKTLGLEVGAFDRPIFTKAEMDVRFLDYKTTEVLRQQADAFVGHDGRFVEEVDYVVPGSGSWEDVPDGAFDWILSAHSLEHSPNLIAILRTMNAKLKPDGLVISMLPDKRRTFDALKPPTTLGQVFEDYYTGKISPRFQAAFDGLYYTRIFSIEEADRIHQQSATLIPSGMPVHECLKRAKASLQCYQDEHNYIFTSQTFETIIREISATGLIGMTTLLHEHTRDGEMTFLNILRKTDAPTDF